VANDGEPRARLPVEQRSLWVTVSALGFTQIFAWGATYNLLAVLAEPIAADTDWPLVSVIGGLSVGLLVAGLISPRAGRAIQSYGGRPMLAMSSVVLGLGLAGLAISPNLVAYLVSCDERSAKGRHFATRRTPKTWQLE
jgi:MFS family permease